MTVAKEIAKQIGNKALFMLGASQLVADDNALRFRIKGSRAANMIRVELNSMDLYDVTFFKVRGLDCKEVAKAEGIYNDMLHNTIEENTGLYTRL